jgi:hypothetical protein
MLVLNRHNGNHKTVEVEISDVACIACCNRISTLSQQQRMALHLVLELCESVTRLVSESFSNSIQMWVAMF